MSKTSQEYVIGESRVHLRIGDILQSEAQVIVSSDDDELSMRGGVSKAILSAVGPALADEARKHVSNLNVGDVVVTSAGKLRFLHVYHVVTRRRRDSGEFDIA